MSIERNGRICWIVQIRWLQDFIIEVVLFKSEVVKSDAKEF